MAWDLFACIYSSEQLTMQSLYVAGFGHSRGKNAWRASWCGGLYGAIKLVTESSMQNEDHTCETKQTDLIIIPDVLYISNFSKPEDLFRTRKLPTLRQRHTKIFFGGLCKDQQASSMAFRCAVSLYICVKQTIARSNMC